MASTNKIRINYLVFDDDDEAENQYIKNIQIAGYNCVPIFINPSDFYDADKNEFNEDTFLQAIVDKTTGINVNLIVSDWNIIDKNDGFSGVVGWDIVQYVIKAKDKLKSKPFLIYSSDIRNASNYILLKIAQEVCNERGKIDDLSLNNFIANILQLRIKFWKRDGTQFNEIITLLKEASTISSIVLDSVLAFDKNMVINTGNIDFDGRRISDILKDNEVDLKGLKFIREIIELSIAHYSELNE
ncbi:hypothetical protein CMU05_14755 [Elizabethkingia anophelis]|nr:hypothetical protein [Elizabethkingia anophelis]MDV4036832.1 hypothetical protein [Elizabethkingia anophelis]